LARTQIAGLSNKKVVLVGVIEPRPGHWPPRGVDIRRPPVNRRQVGRVLSGQQRPVMRWMKMLHSITVPDQSRHLHPGPHVHPELDLDKLATTMAQATLLGHQPPRPRLVAATAAPPPAADTQLGHLFAGIDTIPETPSYPRLDVDQGTDDLDTEDINPEDTDTTGDDEPGTDAKGRPGSLVTLLTGQITQANTPAKQRQQWLATAESVVGRRVEAIVSDKNRSAYARAASLIVGYAETQIIMGTGNGRDYIAGMRQRYPRHTAFRAELDTATRASALAGRPGSPARPRNFAPSCLSTSVDDLGVTRDPRSTYRVAYSALQHGKSHPIS
jgi:hypothetical protein